MEDVPAVDGCGGGFTDRYLHPVESFRYKYKPVYSSATCQYAIRKNVQQLYDWLWAEQDLGGAGVSCRSQEAGVCCGARGGVGVCFGARGSRSVLWSVLRGSLLSPPLHLHYLLTLSEQQTVLL
ncbi:hypothetical protein ACOMHN_049191 [Nucella lapillus]